MEKLWLAHYDPGVPATLEYPHEPLHRLLEQSADRFPDRIATSFFGATLTYRELDALSNRFAQALERLGVSKGDRVGLLLPNCPQFVICYFGALKLGAVVVANNPLYVEREIEHQFKDAGIGIAVVFSRRYPLVNSVRASTRLTRVIVTNIKDYFPPFLRFMYTLVKEKKEGDRQKLREGDLDLKSVLASSPATRPDKRVSPDDLALLQYTGGTTGVPKAAMASHANLVADTLQLKAWLDIPEDRATRFLAAIPFFHVYGMVACMSVALATGSTLYLHPRFAVEDVLKTIQNDGIDYFPGVPAMYVAVNNSPLTPKYNLKSIKACVSGAAPLPLEVKRKFEALTGGKLLEGYGLSEAPTATHANPLNGENREGSIGLPLPDVDCKIVDVADGVTEKPIGEVGELCIRAPEVMLGYWNRPDETKLALREGWLHTGDIAKADEDGYFYIVDRKKDMIISGGYNVYPRDVEEVLFSHPKVKEAAVAGMPDERWGETVTAFVVLREGESATADDLRAFCRERMAAYKVPTSIEFRESLPKTLVGKVLRRVLTEEARKKKPESPNVRV
jgi:long-chain acyl-CoA synthetase